MVQKEAEPYAAFIGSDWADQKHDYCLSPAHATSFDVGTFESRPEEVSAWVNQLRRRFQGRKVALCLEQTRGALIHQLMGTEFIDLYPLNPVET